VTQKHVHRLKKKVYKKTGNAIFFCTLPDCHYKIEAELAVGKISACNLCGNPFMMNEYQIRLVRPHCDNCSKMKVKGPDGKNHYIRKQSTPIMAAVAAEHTEDLRSRLNNVMGSDDEKDI
jgi:hypothetical protein